MTFGGTPAESFVVDTWASIRAIVPDGAQDGPLGVETAVGRGASDAGFDVLAVCS
ncbi:MAG: hypothetical protein GWN07_35165, partial [Actinobacteria bacterium]|nr:hypothetical protein [Actinomycetota bacterium]NIU70658.1 hypothetical protein [Actinomycetota bacterium]NIW32561.1 hypothetical protein [Actinomycetota bacterium]NIX24765.1 hypothetical protein [Actinomycetota bacterium]